MDIIEKINNRIYEDIYITIFINEIFDQNEQNTILKFEQICNAFIKNNKYEKIALKTQQSQTVIKISKKRIWCIKEYFKYVINIAQKYPQICEFSLVPNKDINDDLYNLLCKSPHIKKYNFGSNITEHISFNWKKTYIRYITIYEQVNDTYIFFEWFKQNPQIYSLQNGRMLTDKLIYDFLVNNPPHSLMFIVGTIDRKWCPIDTLFKKKRVTMYKTIKTMLLISNHQHKFKKIELVNH